MSPFSLFYCTFIFWQILANCEETLFENGYLNQKISPCGFIIHIQCGCVCSILGEGMF